MHEHPVEGLPMFGHWWFPRARAMIKLSYFQGREWPFASHIKKKIKIAVSIETLSLHHDHGSVKLHQYWWCHQHYIPRLSLIIPWRHTIVLPVGETRRQHAQSVITWELRNLSWLKAVTNQWMVRESLVSLVIIFTQSYSTTKGQNYL